MIALIITAALIPAAVIAAIILEPHMESWATRKRLNEAHRASQSPPEPCSTIGNPLQNQVSEQRVEGGNSFTGRNKLRA